MRVVTNTAKSSVASRCLKNVFKKSAVCTRIFVSPRRNKRRFCDAKHIGNLPPDYSAIIEKSWCLRRKRMFGLEVIGLLLLAASFTALQFGWLLETARV